MEKDIVQVAKGVRGGRCYDSLAEARIETMRQIRRLPLGPRMPTRNLALAASLEGPRGWRGLQEALSKLLVRPMATYQPAGLQECLRRDLWNRNFRESETHCSSSRLSRGA
jgi:hypothetical protein